jgi:hypothetical protein
LLRAREKEAQPAAASFEASRPADAPQAALSVLVVPETARVSIDGKLAPSGSAVVRGPADSEHVVLAECDGYSPVERHVKLSGDSSMTIELKVQPAPVSEAPRLTSAWRQKSPTKLGKAGSGAVSVAPSAKSGRVNCSPPYYFVGGIKTFKPECI